jgi:predicted O-linked N-acetylglucosamine transferase (SPINDLY family)
MKDISDEFQRSYGRVCRGGLDVFESAETIETAQRINAMQLLVLLWINGWTSEATAALLIPRLAPVQLAWLGNPSFAATKLVDFLVSGDLERPSQALILLADLPQLADTVSSPPDLFHRTPESILYLPVGTSLHVLGQLAMFPRPQHAAPDSHNVTGIPDGAVVAGVLCRIDKWNRQFLSGVARAVSANAHVHLWMPEMLTTASSRSRVMRIFASQGLQPERVHWIPTLDRNKHLQYCACSASSRLISSSCCTGTSVA